VAFDGQGREAVGEDEDDIEWLGRPALEEFRRVSVKGATEVRTAKISAAIGRGALQHDGFEIALLKSAYQEVRVELSVNGIAGEGMVELKA
jgi:hypothetical protein